MADFIPLEAFNLFVGPASADNSKHLIIKNLKLPETEELTQQHHSGGSWGAIDIGGLGMKELMCSFKLSGWDPQTMSQFGINARVAYPYTVYGNARSKATGTAVPIKAIMWGRLTKLAWPEFKRGELMEVDHEVKEILHYELYVDNQEKYYWDWKTTVWRVDGVAQNVDEIQNLGGFTTTGGSGTTAA